jgi:anti-sigma B factor antagonist
MLVHASRHDAMMRRMSVEPDAQAFRPPRFDVAVDEEGDALVLRLSGELDLVSEPMLEAALARAGQGPVRIDMSQLAFMDSTGLRTLLNAARELPGLELHGPLQPAVRRLLELTQTLKILPYRGD